MEEACQCISRGEVWLMEWDNRKTFDGEEETIEVFRYPVLIICTDLQANNPHFPDVVVLPCGIVDESLPNLVYVDIAPSTDNRLPYPIQVAAYMFYTVPKTLLEQRLGRLTAEEMALVSSKIKMVLELD